MRRGKRQVQLDEFILRVVEHTPRKLKGRWVSLDDIDAWATEWTMDEPSDFDDWFMNKFTDKTRYMAVFHSLERLVKLGRIEMRRDQRSTLGGSLQYRVVNILDALAKAAKRSR